MESSREAGDLFQGSITDTFSKSNISKKY